MDMPALSEHWFKAVKDRWPLLRLGWNKIVNRWQVFQVTARGYKCVRTVQNEDGSYRQPDMRLVNELRSAQVELYNANYAEWYRQNQEQPSLEGQLRRERQQMERYEEIWEPYINRLANSTFISMHTGK